MRSIAPLLAIIIGVVANAKADEVLKPITERYSQADVQESPSFQKHVVPLFGRLGCNGRACHGSFQGRGDFRLSLFGYDFQADHDALHAEDSPRVDVDNPLESLILAKPTDADMHEGGLRYEKDGWEYHVIRRWVEEGAAFEKDQIVKLMELRIEPSELLFAKADETVQIKAIAVWEDGTHEDVTPLCRFQSNDEQIATIDKDGLVTSSTGKGDTHLVLSYDKAVVAVPVLRPVSDLVGKNYPEVETPTEVDELVVQKLRKLGVVPSDACTDAEFLRRVSLDLTGTLPKPDEVAAFLADEDPNKRASKVEELLDTPAYAAWWTTKLCDFTGNNTFQLNNTTPSGRAHVEWYDWIHKRVADNVPYDDMVAGIVASKSLKDDESYADFCREMSELSHGSDKSFADRPGMTHYWARRDFQNNVEARAISFAHSFLGLRIQCAQCHKHPFDQWSKDDFHQFKNFFARVAGGRNVSRDYRKEYDTMMEQLGLKGKRGGQVRRELSKLLREGKTVPFPVLYVQPNLQRTRNPDGEYPVFDHAKLLGGDIVEVSKDDIEDPRHAVMEWLRSPDNKYFAHSFVNRVWASYFNVGIVNPPDDMNLANPPSNKALLEYLAKGFIENDFDMKWVHRTIANSRTYQTSWKSNETNAGDERNFSRAVARRLPAEVVYDAIQQATSSDDAIAALHEDPSSRAISVPGADTRRRGNDPKSFALAVFGRSTRDSNCDCDRSSEPSLLQTVFLQNDNSVLELCDVRGDGWLDSVARDLRPKKAAASPQMKKRLAAINKQIAQAERRLKKLRKEGNDNGVQGVKRQLANFNRQLVRFEAQLPADDSVEVSQEKIDQYLTAAYLRTLSRYPNDDELARTQEYVAQADDVVEGMRDVLWALVNTKEFIVNH